MNEDHDQFTAIACARFYVLILLLLQTSPSNNSLFSTNHRPDRGGAKFSVPPQHIVKVYIRISLCRDESSSSSFLSIKHALAPARGVCSSL